MFDSIIIGAGPAGLTAAIYLLRENKKIKIIEKETIGGKIASSSRVDNYPGFLSISGAHLADQLYEQVVNLGGNIDIEEATTIQEDPLRVITDEGDYLTKSIIIATGTKYNMLHLEREKEFIGNGISFCTTCDGAFYKDKDVAVVGGSSSALINASYLSDIARTVYLIVRSNRLKGEDIVIKEVLSKKNIVVLYETQIIQYLGDQDITGVVVRDKDKEKVLDVAGVFLAIGQKPETQGFINLLDLNLDGYISSGEDCYTNIKGVFVAGDVRNKKIRQLTTAVADGTVAAMNVIQYLKEKN